MKKAKSIKTKSTTTKMIFIFSVLAIVAVSGCVGQGFFGGLFGQLGNVFGVDVIKPARQVQTVGVVNPLAIDRVWTLPEETVLPETKLQFFMELSNTDNDPSKEVIAVVDLFDTGILKDSAGNQYCNSYSNPKGFDQCGPKDAVCQAGVDTSTSNRLNSGNPCVLKTGATKQVIFEMSAPTSSEVAGVITKNKINYRVQYFYQGATNFEILVVDYDEILRRQRDGKVLTTNLIDTKGSGPIKIDAELGSQTPYVITQAESSSVQTAVNTKAFITFKLRNAGAGALRNSEVPAGEFQIRIPTSLVSDCGVVEAPVEKNIRTNIRKDLFQCTVDGNNLVFNNLEPIKFFKTESEPFLFTLNEVNKLPEGVPHRTALMSSSVSYIYELRGSKEITINPVLVR